MCYLGNLNYNDNNKLGINKGRIMYVYIRKLYNFQISFTIILNL